MHNQSVLKQLGHTKNNDSMSNKREGFMGHPIIGIPDTGTMYYLHKENNGAKCNISRLEKDDIESKGSSYHHIMMTVETPAHNVIQIVCRVCHSPINSRR